MESLFPDGYSELFQAKLGLDSECVLWTLNPEKAQKSILVRNGTRRIHTLCKDLTTRYPFITMMYYHLPTDRNIADQNSKLPSDLDHIKIIESDTWRFGLPEMNDGTT